MLQQLREPILATVCLLVLTVAFLKGVVYATTPNFGPVIQADITSPPS